MLKKLSPYLLNFYKKELYLSILSSFMETGLQLMIPLVMANIIDIGIMEHDRGYIFKMGLLMIVMAALALFFGLNSARFSSIVGQGTGTNLREAEFAKIQNLSFDAIDRFSTGSLITRLTMDITAIQRAITMSLRMLVRSPFMILVALVLAISISPKLSLVFVVAIPLLVAFVLVLVYFVAPRFTQLQESVDGMNTMVQENLNAIRVVKSFGREELEMQKYDAINENLRQITQKAFHILVLAFPIVQLIIFGTTIAILWMGAGEVYHGRLAIGKLATFLSYVMQILFSVIMVAMMLIMLSRSWASAKRVHEVLETKDEFEESAMKMGEEIEDSSLSFDHVSFRYYKDSNRNVLEDICFSIKTGETLGIIGGTGSGKSTLVQLILRLYEIDHGQIRLGGKDIRNYDPQKLRQAVSLVLQKNTLFQGTIAQNLLWGNLEGTLKDMQEACNMAGADEFIDRMPEGYNSFLDQEGSNLSGGQRQRLCIARSLMSKPKVLVLDDSTSAVDTSTEKKIWSSLKEHLPGTTKIIIAQRITSVQDADKILVLDHGHLCGQGSHDELLKNNEIYGRIYQSQVWGGEDACQKQ